MRFFLILATSSVGSLNFVQGSSSSFNGLANRSADIEGWDSDDSSAGTMFKDVDSEHDEDQELDTFVAASSPRKQNYSPSVLASSRFYSPATTDESRESPFEPVIHSRKSSSASLPILIPAQTITQKDIDEFLSSRLKSVISWNNMRRRVPEYISFQEPLEKTEGNVEIFSDEENEDDTDPDIDGVFGSLSDDEILV